MNNPRSQDVLKVIENFKKVLPMAPGGHNLDMSIGHVNLNPNECGTVHCHGGWYAIAKELHKRSWANYNDGAHAMAMDLGFIGKTCCNSDILNAKISIREWAVDNPYAWGNPAGDLMFRNPLAFWHETKRPSGALYISDIVDHWTEVYERLVALEKAAEVPQYQDLTKDLAILPVNETSDKVKTKEYELHS